MEDGDDDFGDLYADVEVEASSVISNVPTFSQSQFQSDEIGKKNENGLEGFKAERIGEGSDEEKYEDEEEDDDDDDDLNIVLNSDDNGQEKGFSVTRNNANLRSGGGGGGGVGLDDEDYDYEGGGDCAEGDGGGLGKSGPGFGDGIDQSLNGRAGYSSQQSQYKYVRPQSAAYARNLKGNGCWPAASNSYSSLRGNQEDNVFSQRKGFSLMGAQTGHNFSLPRSRTILDINIDIFGQKPWKNPEADITDYFNFGLNEDSWKLYCNQVDEFRHRGPVPSRNLTSEDAPLTERKGRAIQVEDSLVERQSSMDVMHQLAPDSDVIIQITGKDHWEPCSSPFKEGLRHTDNSAPETSDYGDVSVDDGTDSLCFSSASEDELHGVSLEENSGVVGVYAPRREQRSSVKPINRGSENHGSHQISDVEGHPYSTVAICGSEGTDEAVGTSNTNERIGDDTCTTDPSMVEAESSDAEKGPASHSETFENGAYIDRKKSRHERRQSIKSVTELTQSVKADYPRSKDPKRLDDRRKPGDSRYYARQSSPAYKNRKSRDSKPKAHLEQDSFHRSDTEVTFDVHLSAIGHNRQNGRRHAFDSYNREDISYSKESELPCEYYGERFSDSEFGDTSKRHSYLKGHEISGAKKDPYFFRSLDEEEYYHERRRYMKDGEVMGRDWYHNEREFAFENIDSFAHQEFGQLNSNHPSFLKYKRGAQWKRKGDMYFRNRVKEGDYFVGQTYSDNIRRGKYKRSLAYDGRDRNHFDQKYVRHVPYIRREVRSPGSNLRFGSSSVGLKNFRPRVDGNRYLRYGEERSFAFRSLKEPHFLSNSRWHGSMMPRNSVHERRGSNRGHWNERFRDDGSFDNHPDPFDRVENAIDADDPVNIEGRRHHWNSKVQCNEEESMPRHEDAKFPAEGAPFPVERASRRKNLDAEHGSDHVDGLHVEGRRYKLRREGNRGNKFEKPSNVICGGIREQPFRGTDDSLDSHLVDGSDHVEELIDDPHAEGHRHKQTREVNSGNKVDGTSSVIRGGSCKQPLLDCVDSLDSHLADESDPVDELIDTPHAVGHSYEQTREVDSGHKFDISNVMHSESHEKPSLSCRNLLNSNLVVGEGKQSTLQSSGGCFDRTEWSMDELEKHTWMDLDSRLDEKVIQAVGTNEFDEDWLDKIDIPEQTEGWDIEEGQILTEEVNAEPMEDIRGSHPVMQVNDVNELHNQNGKMGFDNPRILEAMAKMEKRRERFKESVTVKSDLDTATKLTVVDLVEETASTKQQRPARKRRWGVS